MERRSRRTARRTSSQAAAARTTSPRAKSSRIPIGAPRRPRSAAAVRSAPTIKRTVRSFISRMGQRGLCQNPPPHVLHAIRLRLRSPSAPAFYGVAGQPTGGKAAPDPVGDGLRSYLPGFIGHLRGSYPGEPGSAGTLRPCGSRDKSSSRSGFRINPHDRPYRGPDAPPIMNATPTIANRRPAARMNGRLPKTEPE